MRKIKVHNSNKIVTILVSLFVILLIPALAYMPVIRASDVIESNSPGDGIYLPIIMYHEIMENKDNINHKRDAISPKLFDSDLNYLKENHYTPIFMGDLISYVEEGTPLPENPIILTFDDGYYNNYYYAYPLLRAYDMKAVISIIGVYTEKFSLINENDIRYSHITWRQINEMLASGLIEIQNHSYDMHSLTKNGRKGIINKPGESPGSYEKALIDDIGSFQERIKEMTGKAPNTFTYPYGFVNNNSKEVLLKEIGFKATLTTYIGVDYISRDPKCLYRLKRIPRPPNVPSEKFFKAIAPESTSQ